MWTENINNLIYKNEIEVNYIYNYDEMLKYLYSIKDKTIACDIETPDFSPLNTTSKILSMGFSETDKKVTVFYTKDLRDEEVKNIINVYNSNVKISIFHNKYFDRYYSMAKYGEGLICHFDTMIGIHTVLIERKLQGKGIGLKELALDYTPFGDYESGLEEFKANYCKENNINKSEFTYDLLPKELLLAYNGIDCIVTMIIYNRIIKYIETLKTKKNWGKVEEILKLKNDVMEEYIIAKLRGINVNRDMIYELDKEFKEKRMMNKIALENSDDIRLATIKICKNEIRDKKKVQISKIRDLASKISSSKDEKVLKKLNRQIENAKNKLNVISSKEYFQDLFDSTEFNFNSNKHKQVLFYDILKIEKKYFTKSKAPSTGKIVLDNYGDKYDILKIFKDYGIYNKGIRGFLGTNDIEGVDYEEEQDDIDDEEQLDEEIASSKSSILACIDKNNKMYPSVNITGTTTSRLSMTHPNIAQYPSSRSELGKIRKCIIPTNGYRFCYFDFAAMEVRLTAVMTQEPTILDAINNNLDLHSMTALKVFGHKMKDLDTSLPLKDKLDFIKKNYGNTYRYWAKSLIFSLLYGTTEHGLSKNLNITKEEAIDMIKDFFNGYTKVKEFMDNNKKMASTKGYVENLHGLRMNTPECIGWTPKSKNYKAERQIRQASNFLIQSLNATYVYKSILTFMKEVRERNLDIHLLFTIYDSLMVEAHESISDEIIIDLFKRHFESEINGVKIEIDIDLGKVNESWYEIS